MHDEAFAAGEWAPASSDDSDDGKNSQAQECVKVRKLKATPARDKEEKDTLDTVLDMNAIFERMQDFEAKIDMQKARIEKLEETVGHLMDDNKDEMAA